MSLNVSRFSRTQNHTHEDTKLIRSISHYRVGLSTLCLSILSFHANAATLTVVPASTFTGPEAIKPGFAAPQGSYRPFDTTGDLAFSGNGTAASAVAKDTIAGVSGIHQSAFSNDGFYGNGASWVSASANSWIKIDLGQVLLFDSLMFGRDRLGSFDDRDPGQFIISTALTDNIYANGDETNDSFEYLDVFSSAALGFTGSITGPQTLKATFTNPVSARYIKLTVSATGTAIDEIQVGAVPEPSTIAFGVIGVLGLAFRRIRNGRSG